MKGVKEERSVSAGHGKASPRFAACGVGDARRVRAVKLGAFGLKPTLARSPERERLRFGGNLLSGPWAATLAFAGQDAEEVASRPAAVWRICRGWQGDGLERRVGKGGFNWRSAPQLQPTCLTQRWAACGVGDARCVCAGRLGTFGLKPTLARSPERERLRCGGNLLSGPWAVTLAFLRDRTRKKWHPAQRLYGAFAGGGKETGWKGVLERAASIEEARPNCSQPAPLNGGCLRGMPLLTGGLHDPAFHRPYRRRACFSPYLPHLPRTGENLC